MSENTVITPASAPAEISEITKEAMLPDSRLMPMECSWAPRQMYTYNRNDLVPPMTMFRLRERDCFVIGDRRITLSISIMDYGFCGAVNVTLVDNSEAKERSKTKILPFTLGSISLPVSASTGDMMYRSEDASVDFLRAPDKWYIRLYFDRFDDVRSLYVNAIVEDVGGDSAFSAVPVGKKGNHFLLRHGLYAMPVSGKVVLGADVYELSADSAIGWLERERSDGGNVPDHSRISISGVCDGTRFGMCFSDSGVFTAENTLIIDGRASRPEELSIQREDGVWYVSTADGYIQLYVPVNAARIDRIKLGSLSAQRHREYGLCFGELTFHGRRHTVTTAIGCGELVTCRC